MAVPVLPVISTIPNIIDPTRFDDDDTPGVDSTGGNIVVTSSGPCRLDRENRVKRNKAKSGSTIAADIREWIQTINEETDCIALQQKCQRCIESLGVNIDETTTAIREKLDEIIPIIKLPSTPLGVIKWLKKFTVGRILPDLDATIDTIKQTIDTAQAIVELIATVQQVRFKLEACAIGTVNTVIAGAENAIDQVVFGLSQSIQNAVGEAICSGLKNAGVTGDNVVDVIEGVQAIDFLLRDLEIVKQSFDNQIGNTLNRLGENQAIIAQITGIPPVLNTSTVDQFITTVNSDQYVQYRQSLTDLVNQPDPINNIRPTISGNTVVGDTLTCSTGQWTVGTNNTEFEFQWMRNDVDIAGANLPTYQISIDDVDSEISCRVTAVTQIAAVDVTSPKVGPIVFELAPDNRPIITGTAANNHTLVCSDGTWPFEPTSIMFEWIRVSSSGQTTRVQSLSGNNIYTVTSADIGSEIVCRVVASSFKYTVSANTQPTLPVTG